MATRLTEPKQFDRTRYEEQNAGFRAEVDEYGRIRPVPLSARPRAGEVFGVDSEREERDQPTPDRTHDFSVVCLRIAYCGGFVTAAYIAAVGWALSLRCR